MKNGYAIAASRLAMLLVGISFIAGCGDGRAPDEAGDDIPGTIETDVTRVGEAAATSLRQGLSARLTAAMAEGGPEAAIDVCAVEAMSLTDSIAAASPASAMKRTSLRVRNPRNAPDAAERAALEWFEERESAGERPTSLVERDGSGYRYYAPLRVAALCVSCHGPSETLAPATRAALDARYPDDAATGYSEGDLRGLIRVTVPAAAIGGGR
jgi:hypothetical protein